MAKNHSLVRELRSHKLCGMAKNKKNKNRTSLVVQGQDCAPNTRGLCLVPGKGTRSHMPQLRPGSA